MLTNQRVNAVGRTFETIFSELERAMSGVIVGRYRPNKGQELLVNDSNFLFSAMMQQFDDHKVNIASTVS